MTNIEIDHLDYYKDEKDYIKAFKQYSENIKE
jgi:mur ligase middle domain